MKMDIEVKYASARYAEVVATEQRSGMMDKNEAIEMAAKLVAAANELLSFAQSH